MAKATVSQDLEQAHDHVHRVDDLIRVVTIFLFGNYLSHHLNLYGFLIFTSVFIKALCILGFCNGITGRADNLYDSAYFCSSVRAFSSQDKAHG